MTWADGSQVPKTLSELAWDMCDALDGLRRRGGVVPEDDAFELWSAYRALLEELAPEGIAKSVYKYPPKVDPCQ